MGTIIGIIILLALIAIVLFEFFLLKTVKTVSEREELMYEEPKKVELSDEQKIRQEKMRKSFENLMGYGYEDALKSSKGE